MAGMKIQVKEKKRPLYSNYPDLLQHGAAYVFDGNRVFARYRVGTNGVGWWRLHTVDLNVSLSIGRDLRVRMYTRTEKSTKVKLIRLFETVFDALKPLDEAVRDCEKHGHVWSPDQASTVEGHVWFVWRWCVLCGEESIVSLNDPDITSPTAATGGTVPKLHGPLFWGEEYDANSWDGASRRTGVVTTFQTHRPMTVLPTHFRKEEIYG
jgi:hypothetical protein